MAEKDERAPEPPAPLVIHEHKHFHDHWWEPPMREAPAARDPAATYDALHRKQPKRLGAIEVVRKLPWLAAAFSNVIPAEHVGIEQGQAVVQCRCEEVTHIEPNHIEPCVGGCGRWFAYVGTTVRWAQEPRVD